MRKALFLFCALACSTWAAAQNKTYYISPLGNDNSNGLTEVTAWKTIEKINTVTFQPGDKILFKSGATWHGQLFPKGSGAKDNPITLSYYGGEERPVIDIDEAEGAGIRLTDQSHWVIDHMEVTSGAQPKLGIGRQGIVAISKDGSQEDLTIRDCYIHDIWGQLGGNTEYCGYNSCCILVKSAYHWSIGPNAKPSEWKDVNVENNTIRRMDKVGIIVLRCKTGMHVHHNYIEDTGGDGIFCGGCDYAKIEYNVARRTCLRSGYQDLVGGMTWWPHTAAIWIQDAYGTVMQYNAVYDTGRQPGNGDGEAYDFDFNCIRCIAQYNYSQNNHGFLLIMNRTFENIARYNISVNDQSHLIQMQCANTERNLIYNNVFYIDYGTVDLDFFCGNNGEKERNSLGAFFVNNIFYATGQSFFRTVYATGEVIGRAFDEQTRVPQGEEGKLFFHNCYFGPWKNGLPNDPEAIVTDPMLIEPGQVSDKGTDPNTLKGYMLCEGSPLIDRGFYAVNGGTRDFFGNKVQDGRPDIGVFEHSSAAASIPSNQEKDVKYTDESNLALAAWSFPEQLEQPKDGILTITTQYPIHQEVTGTVTLSDGRGHRKTINIGKNKSRSVFVFNSEKFDTASTKAEIEVTLKGMTQTRTIPMGEPQR